MRYVVIGIRPGAKWREVTTVEASSHANATELALSDAQHLITVPVEVYDAAWEAAGGQDPTIEEIRKAEIEAFGPEGYRAKGRGCP